MVKRNTRLNAIGRTEVSPRPAVAFEPLVVERKRSFDSLSSTGSLEMEIPDCKRIRCSSPVLGLEEPIRLVSPDPPTLKCRRVTFSMDPPQYFHHATVTPDSSSDEEDTDS
jgi:hypothetical protein